LIREGQDVRSSQPPLIDTSIVSPEYFHLLGMTLLRGRLFADQDLEDTPSIAVINLAAAGAGVGLLGALIVSHLMAGLLYGVAPTDLLTFSVVALVLTAVALAASYIPALRAMRLDPITTLHSE